jgi:hypothetical protein
MRSFHVVVLTGLLAASPAMGQVIIQTPAPPDTARHEQRAMQDRADAHWEHQEAERRAAIGDYQGAADAQRDAHRDWRDAHRQQDRARDESGAVIIGR